MGNNVVVVCCWGDERGLDGDVEAVIALARGITASKSPALHLVVVGPAPDDVNDIAARSCIDQIDRIQHEKLHRFNPDAFVSAMEQYCRELQPTLVLVPQTFEGRTLAPRLAGRVGGAALMNATGFEDLDGTLRVHTSAYGGDTCATYSFAPDCMPVIGVLPSGSDPSPPDHPTQPTSTSFDANLDTIEERIEILASPEVAAESLEDAPIIVAGGRGLGEKDNYALVEELAQALGGLPGASRPLVDEGWTDAARQIGLTGKITRPSLYIAAGISGASQHMAGCSAAQTIVAVNSDPDAAIFRYARYGLVADCREVLPALTRALQGTP